MQAQLLNSIAVCLPALCMGLFRKKWWASLGLWLIAMTLGFGLGLLHLSDFWRLPLDTGLLLPSIPLVLWWVLSMVLGACYRPQIASTREAMLSGLCLGALAAPQVWKNVLDKDKDRVLLTEMIWSSYLGAFLHPAAFLFSAYYLPQFQTLWFFWPLIMIGRVLSRKDTGTLQCSNPSPRWLLGLSFVCLNSVFLSLSIFSGTLSILFSSAVLLGCMVYVGWGKIPFLNVFKDVGFAIGCFLSINVLVAAGLSEWTAWGLEEMPMNYHVYLPSGIMLATLLLSSFVGWLPMSIFGIAVFAQFLDFPSVGLRKEPLQFAYVFGMMLGAMDVFVFGQALRENWRRWLLFVLFAVCYGYLIQR